MIRLPTHLEEIRMLLSAVEVVSELEVETELTAADEEALAEISIEKIMCQVSPTEQNCWKVTDMWGNTIQRFKTFDEALDSALDRNFRAAEMKLWMRYLVSEDQGFDA